MSLGFPYQDTCTTRINTLGHFWLMSRYPILVCITTTIYHLLSCGIQSSYFTPFFTFLDPHLINQSLKIPDLEISKLITNVHIASIFVLTYCFIIVSTRALDLCHKNFLHIISQYLIEQFTSHNFFEFLILSENSVLVFLLGKFFIKNIIDISDGKDEVLFKISIARGLYLVLLESPVLFNSLSMVVPDFNSCDNSWSIFLQVPRIVRKSFDAHIEVL